MNWLLQTYDKNDMILEELCIKDCLEVEALKSAEAYVESQRDVEDWTLIEISRAECSLYFEL